MSFRFDANKVAQATAYMLKSMNEKRHNFMALLKMLYIADRQSLKETGFPITGDTYAAMKHGPVLSRTYDLMKTSEDWPEKDSEERLWTEHFRRDNCDLCLLRDPGSGELSEYEMEKLQDVCRRFGARDRFELADFTHTFPEWKKNDPGDSSVTIELTDLLDAVDRGNDIEAILQSAREDRYFSSLFAGR